MRISGVSGDGNVKKVTVSRCLLYMINWTGLVL